MTIPSATLPAPTGRLWTIGIWTAQIVLAGMFGMSGYMHFVSPVEALVQMGMSWAGDAPIALVRFIGIAELAGALGLILPAATRIMPLLTPFAALGLAVIQVLAIGVHVVRGEFLVTPFNLVLLALALLVVWGRWVKAPITPRN